MAASEPRPAWLLHYQPFRDTSFIVDAFTLEAGRLGLVARGARASRPAIRALYQPFQPLLLAWSGRGDLVTLTGIEAAGRALGFDNRSLACAYYLNELLLRLLEKWQPQPELFAYYGAALEALSAASGSIELQRPLRRFELQLLEELGRLPDLAHCRDPQDEPAVPEHTSDNALAIDANARYRFDAASSMARLEFGAPDVIADRAPGLPLAKGIAGAASPSAGTASAAGSVSVAGATLLALARLDLASLDETGLDEARRLMRALVAEQLGGQPLKSRAVFAELNSLQPSSEQDSGPTSDV